MRSGETGYKHVQVSRKGGVLRYYFRKPGFERCALEGVPGSDEFAASYAAALARGPKAIKSIEAAPPAGTVAAMVYDFRRSLAFTDRPASVRTPWNRVYDKLVRNAGDLAILEFNHDCITDILRSIASTPAKRNETRRAYMDLFAWALAQMDPDKPSRNRYGLLSNPMAGIKKLRSKNPDGWHTLTPAEVERFRGKHPVGTVARAAVEIMFWEGFRASDTREVGPHSIRGAEWDFVQRKNRDNDRAYHRRGEVNPELIAILRATPVPGMTDAAGNPVMVWDITDGGPFLRNEQGRAFSRGGFTKAMRRWCNDAGLKHCSAHGVRKRCGNDLAEARATGAEISAVLGHRDEGSARPYVAKANRATLANNGHKARRTFLAGGEAVAFGEGATDLATLIKLAAAMGYALVPVAKAA